MKALLPLKIDFFRWRSRNDERSVTSEANGELSMHFRIYDLAADRCVWSIPPIDTVPVKLRAQKLVVRAIDNDGGVFEVVRVDGVRLADLATEFLADRKVNRLNIHLAADDSYAGRVVRHDNQQELLDRTYLTFDRR
jgi:Protein of unknown function (DUF1203)